jgi:hypothetical protein
MILFRLAMVVSLLPAVPGTVAIAQEKRRDDSTSKPSWKLVFRDEFDGKGIDTSKWNLRDPWGRERNRELQAYVEDAFEVQDGILRIKAEKRTANYGGKQRAFTSGMMTTYQKFSQQYGRFEIRCRMPKGKGLWPAFWLLPEPLGWGYNDAVEHLTKFNTPETLKAAHELRKNMEAAYRTGDRKLIELLDAQKAYVDRLGHVIEFKSFYWRSLNKLNAAVGLKVYEPEKGPTETNGEEAARK